MFFYGDFLSAEPFFKADPVVVFLAALELLISELPKPEGMISVSALPPIRLSL
jgi:hypothetical protein